MKKKKEKNTLDKEALCERLIMQSSPYELLFSVFEEVCFSAESMSSSFVLLEADK